MMRRTLALIIVSVSTAPSGVQCIVDLPCHGCNGLSILAHCEAVV
jgi:hypothetical protein